MLLLAAVFWVFSQILQIFVHYIALLSYSNHNHFLDQPDNSCKKNVAPKEKRTTNKIGNENGVMFYNHFHIYALSGYAIGPERVISMLLRWMQLVEFLIKCKYAEDTHDQDTWTYIHTHTHFHPHTKHAAIKLLLGQRLCIWLKIWTDIQMQKSVANQFGPWSVWMYLN